MSYLWKFWRRNYALSEDEIDERLVDVSVYSFRDQDDDNMDNKNIRFHYFSKPDVKNASLVRTPLSHVVKSKGVEDSIRLVPELTQVKIAIEENKKNNNVAETFSGVPVFQLDKLRCQVSINGKKPVKEYRPAFLRKDLENFTATLPSLSLDQIKGDPIMVSTLEGIIQEMKDSSISKSNDILFLGDGRIGQD